LTSSSAVLQERMGSPSASTVHEPHNPRPQPNFVPVIASSSRRTQSRGVSLEAVTSWGLPLMVSFMAPPFSCQLPVARCPSSPGNRQLATGNWQLATGNWQLATGNWQLATGNRQLYRE